MAMAQPMAITAGSMRRHRYAVLLCDLCAAYYGRGWMTGTGGGMSLQPPPLPPGATSSASRDGAHNGADGNAIDAADAAANADEHEDEDDDAAAEKEDEGRPEYIYLTPSGVMKERLQPRDLFVYDTTSRSYAYIPHLRKMDSRAAAGRAVAKPSASTPLFLHLHEQRGARCVVHTHSLYANLVTTLPRTPADSVKTAESADAADAAAAVATTAAGESACAQGESARRFPSWRCTHQEYIKGLSCLATNTAYANSDTLSVAVIPNRATEDLLLADLSAAAAQRDEGGRSAPCVLVQDHGAYHYASTGWEKCKVQVECLEYLFELDWRRRTAGH